MPAITLPQLTTATINGTGVFDVLMRASKEHLEQEFTQNRLKGPEYATVYLGQLQSILNTSMQFLLTAKKIGLEEDLLALQITLAGIQVQKAEKELLILDKELLKIDAQIEQAEAQTAVLVQQAENLAAELPKIVAEVAQLTAQTALTEQQTLNAITENTVLVAQECKLRAEFDFTMENVLKAAAEKVLLAQKTATEKAQTVTLGVDEDSVIGRQKLLYRAQTDGFTRDAEQKTAKILIDTWNARRMTDDATVADSTNKLDDPTVGRVVTKMLDGINA